mgnify:CR=1 FL=1
MELVRYELKVGLVKGIVFGIREYDFYDREQEVAEKDVVLYLGMIQLVLTFVYAKK